MEFIQNKRYNNRSNNYIVQSLAADNCLRSCLAEPNLWLKFLLFQWKEDAETQLSWRKLGRLFQGQDQVSYLFLFIISYSK